MEKPQTDVAKGTHEKVIELIKFDMENGKIKGGERVLDAGAGTGALSFELQRLGLKPRACDKDPSKFRLDIPCDKVDLNSRLPYRDSQFGCVVCVEVIEHVENPWALIREFHRILKLNGILILTTPNLHSLGSRVIFFLTSKLPWGFGEISGHITPVFVQILEKMIYEKFEIEQETYNRYPLPVLHIGIPIKTRFFGEITILKMRRIEGRHLS